MKADWIESCASAAQREVGDVDSNVVQRLRLELATSLTARELRSRELNELADDLIGLLVLASDHTPDEGTLDADKKSRS
jgi:hypothetical protein